VPMRRDSVQPYQSVESGDGIVHRWAAPPSGSIEAYQCDSANTLDGASSQPRLAVLLTQEISGKMIHPPNPVAHLLCLAQPLAGGGLTKAVLVLHERSLGCR